MSLAVNSSELPNCTAVFKRACSFANRTNLYNRHAHLVCSRITNCAAVLKRICSLRQSIDRGKSAECRWSARCGEMMCYSFDSTWQTWMIVRAQKWTLDPGRWSSNLNAQRPWIIIRYVSFSNNGGSARNSQIALKFSNCALKFVKIWNEIRNFVFTKILSVKTSLLSRGCALHPLLTGLRPSPPSKWVLNVWPQWYWIIITVHIPFLVFLKPLFYTSHYLTYKPLTENLCF